MSTLIDDLADNDALMLALGRIVLRSAELGEAIDTVIYRLDSAKGKESRALMLGRKLRLAKTTARSALSADQEFCHHFMSLCDDTVLLIQQERNSPIHSTFLADDIEGNVIKWDTQLELESIRIDDLNKGAEKIKAKTKRFRQFLHEIQNFQALGPAGVSRR
jgi:hypothetical protein